MLDNSNDTRFDIFRRVRGRPWPGGRGRARTEPPEGYAHGPTSPSRGSRARSTQLRLALDGDDR